MRFGHHSFLREAIIREQEAEWLLRRHRRRRTVGRRREQARSRPTPTLGGYVLLFAIILGLILAFD